MTFLYSGWPLSCAFNRIPPYSMHRFNFRISQADLLDSNPQLNLNNLSKIRLDSKEGRLPCLIRGSAVKRSNSEAS
jgi:hypothetical protein